MKTSWKQLAWTVAILVGLCVGQAMGTTIESAGSGYWTNPASWYPAQVPVSTDDVTIVTGHTNTISTNVSISIASLTIRTNGVLTHLANGTTGQGERYKIILTIGGNLTIDRGGKIDVEGKGYSAGNGPGIGSHGGLGAPYGGYTSGATYDSFLAPTNVGSGGLGGGSSSGGGAVILNVTGASDLSGTINANGGTTTQGWGAPGGSVYLRTGTITGSPTITANGSSAAGGQGGGRIAIILTGADADFSNFGGATLSAFGGASGYGNGAAGTIYKETKAQAGGQGVLTIDNINRSAAVDVTTAIPANQTWTVPFITLSRGGILGIPSGVTFNLTNTTMTYDAVTYNSGITLNGGALIIPDAFSYTNLILRYLSSSTFNPVSITIGNHAQFITHLAYTVPSDFTVLTGGTFTAGNGIFAVGGNVSVAGGTLTHLANGTTTQGEMYKLNLSIASNLTINANGKIDVDGKGYSSGQGPGVGSHGGLGAIYQSIPVGLTYGSITAPTNLGSGGLNNGSHGGGAAILTVAGASELSGTISAIGEIKEGWAAPGGSVYIRTKTITGSPTIKANGSSAAGAGGGGRIAIVLTGEGETFSGFGGAVLSAYGASGGAAGTIYKETADQGPGKGILLIDANNVVSTVATLISSNVTDTVVGTVIITNKAVFQIDTNQSLTVNGSWTNAASFIANSNSTVAFASANPATIAGSNTFWNLTCTNAGKVVYFEAGKTNRVNRLLKLGAPGLEGPMVTLRSTTAGNGSGLILDLVTGTQQLGRVNVKDSNATGGQQLTAGRGSVSEGNNVNWLFPKMGGAVIMVW